MMFSTNNKEETEIMPVHLMPLASSNKLLAFFRYDFWLESRILEKVSQIIINFSRMTGHIPIIFAAYFCQASVVDHGNCKILL